MARILVTNDDGVHSPGLYALARMAVELGHDVVVAAPSTEASGSGAAIIGADEHGRVTIEHREQDGLQVYSVGAAPALIALLGAHGSFGAPPDLVLSGINRGANVGRVVLHSGTVGAALTAGANGARGLAVSLDVGLRPDALHWDSAAAAAATVLDAVLAAEEGTVVNVNAPNTATPAELEWAGLSTFGIVQTIVAEPGEAGGARLTIADPQAELEPGTDAALLRDGLAVATAITGIGEAPPLAR